MFCNFKQTVILGVFSVALCLSLGVFSFALFSWVSGIPVVASVSGQSSGSVYYVSPSGTATNAGTQAAPWSLAKANASLQPGDTAILLGGTYNAVTIRPSASPTSEAGRITYRVANGQTATIQGGTEAFNLSGKRYITIDGIQSTGTRYFGTIDDGHYNHVINSQFRDSTYGRWAGMLLNKATHNVFRNNLFTGHGTVNLSTGQDMGDMVDLRPTATHNIFENNEFSRGGHSLFALKGQMNVFIDNYFHHEVWVEGYGNRTLNTQNASHPTGGDRNLFEGNRFAFASIPIDVNYADGIQLASSYNIFRYNAFYSNQGNGIKMTSFDTNVATYNQIYNNVFYRNGAAGTKDQNANERWGVRFRQHSGSLVGNLVINNIMWENPSGAIGFTNNVNQSAQIIANNLTTQNPQFTNGTVPNPSNRNLPDFRLQAGSPAIDAGRHLTTVTSAGSGTRVRVANAHAFFDGWGISGVQADTIRIGSGQPVRIRQIIYGANEIVLAESRNWSAGDGVFLQTDTRGNVVFLGLAPDIGMHESSTQTSQPTATPTPTSIILPTATPTPTPITPPTATPTPTPIIPPTITPTPSDSTLPIKPGDVNRDGRVDIEDYSLIIRYFGQEKCEYNVARGCIIDIFDFAEVIINFGT